jgi:hypothetical protein
MRNVALMMALSRPLLPPLRARPHRPTRLAGLVQLLGHQLGLDLGS